MAANLPTPPATHWRYVSRCACGGLDRLRYSHLSRPHTELQILPTRGVYRVLERGALLYEKPIGEVEDEIA